MPVGIAAPFELTPDVLHQRFLKTTPVPNVAAVLKALEAHSVQTQGIDAVIVSTCTGYLCPSLTNYAPEMPGLRPDVLALNLVGQDGGDAGWPRGRDRGRTACLGRRVGWTH